MSASYVSQMIVLTLIYRTFMQWNPIDPEFISKEEVKFNKSERSAMIIALIILGCVIAVAGIGFLIYSKCFDHKKNKKTDKDDHF